MPASTDDDRRRLDPADYYDRFAATYEDRRHHGYHQLIDDLEGGLAVAAGAGRDVLEVGCGTGLILRQVAQVARSAAGIDISARMLDVARSRGLDVQQGTATELPFEDESVDLCYSFKVLSHVPELEQALDEMARVTRPQGVVLIELYNQHSLRYLLRRLRGGQPIERDLDDAQVFCRYYTPGEAAARLPSSLRLVRVHGVRIFTLLPQSVGWPLLGRALRRLEGWSMDSALARLGGFLILECEKVG
jgi:ubiquinone/menaquinone biosynthesis C-methylase UbiE